MTDHEVIRFYPVLIDRTRTRIRIKPHQRSQLESYFHQHMKLGMDDTVTFSWDDNCLIATVSAEGADADDIVLGWIDVYTDFNDDDAHMAIINSRTGRWYCRTCTPHYVLAPDENCYVVGADMPISK